MHSPIKSFVLRCGRLSHRQKIALDEWLPDYLMPEPGKSWNFSNTFGRTAETIVEIGFGMGDSLIAMAETNPDKNFIGIEVHRPGIGALVARLKETRLENIRVAPYDAVALFQNNIPENSLSRINIFFPDPWPKTRHHKRRLIQPDFVRLLASKLKVDGIIHCATDWENYAFQMKDVLDAEPLLSNTQHGFATRPDERPVTKFEQRGKRLGHQVWDLVFVRLA